MPPIRRLCVQWPRFGPYHLARLEAAHRVLSPRGVEVIGLETATAEKLNSWEVEQGAVGFRREQVFPGRVFEEVTPAEMEAGVMAALDRLDPDAVAIMSYGFPDARACLAWCRQNRRVAIITTDTKADDAPRVGWREQIKRVIVNEYDAAFVSGTPQRRYLEQLGFPSALISEGCNVVDNAFFDARAREARATPEPYRHLPGLECDAPFFLAVSRLLPLKNLDGLLRAYARYRASTVAPWRLLLVGDGSDRERLERIVSDERIEGVTFCGYHQAATIGAYYGRASALVLPSFKDTWGLVVNEAMAAGLPVLVSRKAGCWMDLVEEGRNGFTFDPDDLDAITVCLRDVAADSTDREAMGARSREIISAYTPERYAEGLLEAANAGLARSNRRANPLALAALGMIRRLSRDVTAFHSAEL